MRSNPGTKYSTKIRIKTFQVDKWNRVAQRYEVFHKNKD